MELKRVVGIGASAGGLEALQTFFDSMPVKSGMAFVVVQHLSPDFKSLMDELLIRHTEMRVILAENEMPLEPDCVYLNPPRKDMIISQGRLLLSDKDPREKLTLPIDTFFRSLAIDQGERSVAIVLSGTGSDGSRSLQGIVDEGGLVIVQAEDSAAFDGMPKSAIATGLAHYIVTPERMAAVLMEEVSNATRPESAVRLPTGTFPEPGTIQHIFRILQDEFGLDFAQYKPSTVGRRLERRMLLTNSDRVEDYVSRLLLDKAERNALYHDLLIGVTRFFRDPEAFQRLARDVIPPLVDACEPEDEIRVWIPGCATGEEVYSICILFREYIDRKKLDTRVKVFATDVHRNSLDRGSAGTYLEETVEAVEPALLAKYFTREDDHYIVKSIIRQMVAFAPQNLLRDPPFTRIDLLICRNLLIYFEPHAQQRILSLFHFSVRTNGFLFLGPSESLGKLGEYFDEVDRHWKVYRKSRDTRLPAEMRRPIPATLIPQREIERSPVAAYTEQGASSTHALRLYDALLNDFMPPGILFTHDGQLLHAFGDTKTFLEPLSGRPKLDISTMLIDDLRLPFASALERARKSGENVSLNGISTSGDNGPRLFDLEIRIIDVVAGPAEHFLAVIRQQGGSATPARKPAQDFQFDEESKKRLESLERELQYTKEHLRTTIEELETSNEELQASNEELLASNEELQSTNEELHSLNEELYTVNSEHQAKITELTELTDDMNNLMRSSNIGTLFVDSELRIRRFTPAAAALFNIMNQDIGRSLEHFTSKFDTPEFVRDIKQVLETDDLLERSIEFEDGEHYLLRIMPYHTEKGDVEGVVAAFVDISSLRRAESALARQTQLLGMVMDTVSDGVVVADEDGRLTVFNRAARLLLGKGTVDTAPADWATDYGIFRPDETTPIPPEEFPLARALRGDTVHRYECFVRNDSLPHGRHLSISSAPLPPIAGKEPGGVCTFHDTTQRVKRFRRLQMTQAELEATVRNKTEELELSESRYRLAMEAAEMGTWYFDSELDRDRRSAEMNRILGLPAEDTEQGLEDFVSRLHPDDRGRFKSAIEVAIEGDGEYAMDLRIRRGDGSIRWVRDRGRVVHRRDNGSIIMTGAIVDITSQHEAQETERVLKSQLEESLHIREEELDRLYQALPAGAIVLDQRDCIVRINAITAQLHGINKEHCSGQMLEINAPELWSAVAEHIAEVRHTGKPVYNIQLQVPARDYTRDEQVFEASFFPVRLKSGDMGTGLILADTTPLTRTRNALEQRERLLELVVDSMNVIVCQWDIASNMAEWGPNFTDTFGHPAGSIKNAHAWWTERVHPEDRGEFNAAFERYREPDERTWQCEYSFQRSNGTYAQVRHLFTVIRNEKGEPTRLAGALIDLTKQNKIMDALKQRNIDLETLVYIISHDLKEPLRSIRTFTDLLSKEHARALDADGLDLLERLSRNSSRLDVLINDVLELSRAQQLEVPDEGTDGRSLVLEAVTQLQDAIDASGAVVNVADQMPNVYVNRRWITEALYNLLHNAMKFHREGVTPEIDVYPYAPVGDEPPMKGFVIADRGPGVADESRDRIFELFRKGESGTEGTGAGLAIVREVAQRHNGNAWYRPRSGGGSEFVITLGETGDER